MARGARRRCQLAAVPGFSPLGHQRVSVQVDTSYLELHFRMRAIPPRSGDGEDLPSVYAAGQQGMSMIVSAPDDDFKVSVVIPTHNRERKLIEALQSVVSQS